MIIKKGTKKNMAQYNRKDIDSDEFKRRFQAYCYAQNKEADIAKYFGISVNTLDKWCKKHFDKGYKDSCRMFNTNGVSNAKNKLYDMAMNGNTACLIFYLKNFANMSDNPRATSVSLEIAKETFAALKQAADKRALRTAKNIDKNMSKESIDNGGE